MPSIFYLDYVNGLDATTDTPLGWWSVAFTGGTTPAPVAGETVTGAISGKTAKVTAIGALTGGSWVGGDAAGTMYFYGKSGAFVAEQVNFAGGGHMHIAADFIYCAWKTITAGPTAARIAAGDVVRIAKSPNPVSIGNATWNDLSKTVTLATAQTLNVDRCEVAWTAVHGAVTRQPVATDAKEGSFCMQITEDAAPGADEVQAYYPTGALDLHLYQKLSFWIKNEVAIPDNTRWIIKLYTTADASGVACDEFIIPAVPSTARWLPLTIARTGGGNLNAAVASIALVNGAGLPTASKYIRLDNIIACTTAGLNLQSLISKTSVAQGGTEGFYGIQSINGTAVLLDTDTNNPANTGKGYSGATGLAATYIRETIKTDLAAVINTFVQEVQKSGTAGNNIEYQAGYDPATNLQDGETFFDGLNGYGDAIFLSAKSYITLNWLAVCRYNIGMTIDGSSYITVPNCSNANNCSIHGFFFGSYSTFNTATNIINANNNGSYGVSFGNEANNNTVTTITNANNNGVGVYFGSRANNNTVTTITNANNNSSYGVSFSYCHHNTVTTITNANNNGVGVYFSSCAKNMIMAIANANNNTLYAVQFASSYLNAIWSLSTTGSGTRAISIDYGVNYLYNALIAEANEVGGFIGYADARIYSNKHDQAANNHWVFTDGGTINSQAVTRVGATGLEWKLLITSATRASNYPLDLSIAKIAVAAGSLVTVKAYFTKSHATNIGAKLVCLGGQIAGVPADVTATKADDVNPEQLTITFTPTEAGVVEIKALAYYAAANGSVLVDTMTITQA